MTPRKRIDSHQYRKNQAKLRAKRLPCSWCGKPINYESENPNANDAFSADHIIPKSKGGGDMLSNLVPMHLGCNKKLGTKDQLIATKTLKFPTVNPYTLREEG